MSQTFPQSFARNFVRVIAATAGIAAMLLASGTAHAQGLYSRPSSTLNAPGAPQAVAAADFGRSGYQSMVVTNNTSNRMSVYLATGPGTFANAFAYGTCTGPTAVIAADFNMDGYPDIVVACPSANVVEAFLNEGAAAPGSFFPGTTYTVSDPVAITAGDFLGNGTMDLAAASGNDAGITVILNINGTAETRNFSLDATLTGIVAGDFNHDGHLDLAISDSSGNDVHIYTGDGTGNFTPLGSYSTGTGSKPSGIVAADFNNDGNLDVATSNAGKNTATILLGSASGALTPQTAQATGTDPIGIAVADVNSDGYPDVITFDSPTKTTGEVDVLLGNGNGTLQAAQVSSETFVPGTLASVADFNRDGKPDIALTQQSTNQVSILVNNTLPTQYPDGRSYSAARALTNGYGNMADSVATGDFNKDGLLDIAVTYLEDNVVRVMTNNGNGFNTASSYAVGAQPYWVASGDLNGDGYTDLVTANTNVNGATGSVSVLLNAKNGTFAPAVNYNVGNQPYQVAIGDINGDGYPDLAVTNYGGNTVSILMGSKTGAFTVSPTTLATCANPYGVAIGDFAGNGYPSIAVTCTTSSQLEVFPNNGNGTFGTPGLYTTDTHPGSLVVGDFNRDGKLDIVVGNTTANDIYFFAGNGNNTFNAGVMSPSLNFPDSIAAGDINGDGILDIVGVAPNFNDVVVTLGVGDGTFGTFDQRSAGEFPAAKQPWAVALGDFNNDGKLDIVTANTYNQVNIASPAYQSRYMAEYPAIPAGVQSIDVLTNTSGANITVGSSPVSPLSPTNSGTTVTASLSPAISGATPTGSVIFEDATGAAVGSGPYALNDGVATYSVGHLGSGSYLFTTLYSGDANFQPTTVSGSNATITVTGTPVTLVLSASSVDLGSKFTATVTVLGNATTGGYPEGTATIYAIASGSTTPVAIGTTNTLQRVGGGNTSTGTVTITANAPNLNVGTYELYAVYNPNGGGNRYAQGSSSNEPLTVITVIPTTTALNCSVALVSTTCTATVTVNSGGYPPNGDTVTFTASGVGPEVLPLTNGTTGTYSFYNVLGGFTITATFTAQGNYGTSSSSVSGTCYILFCVPNARGSSPITLDSLTGIGNERLPNQPAALKTNKAVPLQFF